MLAEEGVKVAVCSRTQSELERTAKEIRDGTGVEVLAFAGDLDRHDTIRELIAATVGHFGRLDILVNNSGGPPLARAASATEEQWATALQRSLLFFARMSREAIPHLKRHGSGRIIRSGQHRLSTHPNHLRSRAPPAWGWWRSPRAGRRVGQDGILVNSVCPGSILTERMLNVTARAKGTGISVEEGIARAPPRPQWVASGA